jgi:hypothetical protein
MDIIIMPKWIVPKMELELEEGEFKPREPLDDDFPEGYMQSDKDFVNCNIGICVQFLEHLEKCMVKD